MAYKVQDVVDRALVILQDAKMVRYTEPQLLALVNDAIELAYDTRPDLRVGQYGTPFTPLTALTQDFPLPSRFVSPVADYVAGRAELRDDEFALDGRAMALSGVLTRVLLSGV